MARRSHAGRRVGIVLRPVDLIEVGRFSFPELVAAGAFKADWGLALSSVIFPFVSIARNELSVASVNVRPLSGKAAGRIGP
jgi:hypothetical protein